MVNKLKKSSSRPIKERFQKVVKTPFTPFNKIKDNKWFKIFMFCLALYFFIVSIRMMGHGFEDMGNDFSRSLIESTTNPLVGLFIRILATSLVQSSSVTTSVVVTLVAAQPEFLPNAIPIIMGANIGTSVTNTLVSIGHIKRPKEFERAFSAATVHDFFNLLTVLILFSVEMITRQIFGIGFLQWLATELVDVMGIHANMTFLSPIKAVTDPIAMGVVSNFGAFMGIVVSAIMLILALKILVQNTRILMEGKIQNYMDRYIFKTVITAYMFGMLLTMFVQSSSITTSLAVPLVGGNILSLEQIFPYTVGANVGTTITAIIAAFALGSSAAITVSFVHLLFNFFGTMIFLPIKRMRKIPVSIAKRFARLAVEKKKYVVIYILSVFYIIPVLVIVLSWVI